MHIKAKYYFRLLGVSKMMVIILKRKDKADRYSTAIRDLSYGLGLIVIYYILNNLLVIGGLMK
jgi:hypothetical protein